MPAARARLIIEGSRSVALVVVLHRRRYLIVLRSSTLVPPPWRRLLLLAGKSMAKSTGRKVLPSYQPRGQHPEAVDETVFDMIVKSCQECNLARMPTVVRGIVNHQNLSAFLTGQQQRFRSRCRHERGQVFPSIPWHKSCSFSRDLAKVSCLD